jgi:hypothetical protein
VVSGWQEYVALARQLDDIRRTGEQSAAEVTRQQEAVSAGFAALDQRLAAQRERLTRLGGIVGQPYGNQPVQPAHLPDPVQALHLARLRAEEADAASAQAEQLAQYPPLFPMWTPLARNLTVYALCAAAAVVIQIALLVAADVDRIDPLTLLAWLCAGLPAMAFFAGVTVISIWGKPRLVPGGAPVRHLRLGFAICLLAMPVAFCAYKLFTAVVLP